MIAKRSCASGWRYINTRQSRSWIITRSARSCTGFPGWALSTPYCAVSCLPSGRTRLRGKLSNFAATQSFNAKQAWSSAFTQPKVSTPNEHGVQPSGCKRSGAGSSLNSNQQPTNSSVTGLEFSLHATQSFNSEQAWRSAFRLQEIRSRLKPELRPRAHELIRDRSGVQPSRNPKFQLRTSMEFSLQAARDPGQAQA